MERIVSKPVEAIHQRIGVAGAGLAVPFAESRNGDFELVHADEGVIYIDKGTSHAGHLGELTIPSNSIAREFRDPIPDTREFALVRNGLPAQEVVCAGTRSEGIGEGTTPLSLVGDLLDDTGKKLKELVDESHRSTFIQAEVDHVRYSPDNNGATFTSVDKQHRDIARSSQIIFATGSSEVPLDLGNETLNNRRVLSHDIFRADRLRDSIVEQVAQSPYKGAVVVIGNRHSAGSVLHTLSRWFEEEIDPKTGLIVVAGRQKPPYYFDTIEEANERGVKPRTICPDTGRVDRYEGVRGVAREELLKARDPNNLAHLVYEDYRKIIEQFNPVIIIQAIGLMVQAIPIVDTSGQIIGPQRDDVDDRPNKRKVRRDNVGRLYTSSGEIIPGAYGIGTGYGEKQEGIFIEAMNAYWEKDGPRIANAQKNSRKQRR